MNYFKRQELEKLLSENKRLKKNLDFFTDNFNKAEHTIYLQEEKIKELKKLYTKLNKKHERLKYYYENSNN